MTGGNFIVGIWKEMKLFFQAHIESLIFLEYIYVYIPLLEFPVQLVVVVVVSSDAEPLFQFLFGGPTRALCQLPEMEII